MKNPRFSALKHVSGKKQSLEYEENLRPAELFGLFVFNTAIMEKVLSKDAYKNLQNAINGKEKLHPHFADAIAAAMKEWAIGKGATHFCHWFQPLTGTSAEKHDSFIEWVAHDKVIEKFSGKQLLQGEPDASSFPSGGLRSTHEARGYTGWDPSSPAFIWNTGSGITLCIPSVYFSWTGEALDAKIPLLRSEKKLSDAVIRLLKFAGIPAHAVFSTLGCEQEYFIIDKSMRDLRSDLLLAGRTVFGAPSPKGQELQDHYFGSVKNRVLSYMQDFEKESIKLGIPVKTRHNEVAPGQHEMAPVFEKTSKAIDHNIMLMEVMRQVAVKHDLACLLHEKPFRGLNGSGKHCNWSLSTDTGFNLLDPSEIPENNIHFLILLVAIITAVHRHSALLRASVASAGNDLRLGGHEAPPPIISIYLGKELEAALDVIETSQKREKEGGKGFFDLGLESIPEMIKDNTDRNRTSPFAFTGNKFEFRAVGSSANPSFPVTVINAIVAESLNEIMDEIDTLTGKEGCARNALFEVLTPVLRKFLRKSRAVCFEGDNYSKYWEQQASKRGLPVLKKSVDSFGVLISDSTIKVFGGILSPKELKCRYEVAFESYINIVQMEASLMLDMFRTQVLPAALEQQKLTAESLAAYLRVVEAGCRPVEQEKSLQEICRLIEESLQRACHLDERLSHAEKIDSIQEKGLYYSQHVCCSGDRLREAVDRLESIIGDQLWSIPKYRELLFMV